MISIVVPLFNQGKYLPDCLESIFKQTLESFEIIVCNDGSTDNSLEIAKKYPVKVISQVNKGLSSARNTGIMNASGEYILPLDADDVLVPDALNEIQNYIELTHADVVAPSFKTFGTTNQEIILMKDPKLEDFKVANRIGYCSAIKKSVLLEVGGYSPRMTFGYEDLHLWVNLLTRGKKIVTIPEVLWMYRTKEKSMYHDALSHHVELMNQIFKDFPQFGTYMINDPLPK